MNARPITYKQLEQAIKIAFNGDEDIFKYYDSSSKVETVEDIAIDIIKKIQTHDEIVIKGVYDKNKLVGFYVIARRLLISFSLSVSYRVRKYLNEFWSLIREEFKGVFKCYLWTDNVRAIKFLIKHGMRVTNYNNTLTELTCL